MRFEFHHPWVLLLLVPALALLWLRLRTRRGSAAILFPSVARVKGLRPTTRQRLRAVVPVLQALAVIAFIIAAARPRQGDARTIVRSEGIAIQMVLDRSYSMEKTMRYQGRKEKRIEIVKDVFARFVGGGDGLPGRKTDLIGLTTFARFTEESCPLVSAHEPVLTAVKNLNTVMPLLDKYDQPTRDPRNSRERGLRESPLNATAIGDGLQRAVLSLVTAEEDLARGEDQGGYKIKGKVAIVLTDGENNAGEDPVEAGQSAAANGIRVYAIIFTELVQTDEDPWTGVERVIGELSEDQVLREAREIVKPSGGHAFLARSGDELREIYQEIDRLERSDVGRIEFKSYHEKYRWFLIPGIVAALVAFFLAETVFRSIP
jgi:Ca-activated chloride channel family protein